MTRIQKLIRNIVLAGGIGALTAGFIAAAGSTADAAAGFDSCPNDMSRRAVRLQANQTQYPAVCRLSQCKPIAPSPHVTYAAKYYQCQTLPWPNPPSYCTQFLYDVEAAPAPSNFCPSDVEAGGTTHWISN